MAVMHVEQKPSLFARYSIFALGYNLLVILWGVFLRSSKSGDGCGQHWLTCNGEVLPSAPQLKTVIEYSHRIMSALDGIVVLVLVIWALIIWRKTDTDQSWSTFRFAALSLVFVITEALVGAGLVLTGNTADNLTAARPFWMAAHLINTLILLVFLTLTARRAYGGEALNFNVKTKYRSAIAVGAAAILVVGITGSIAALSHMIFPSGTIAESMAKDFSPTSNILLRLRLLHPITAILTSVFLVFLTGWLSKESGKNKLVARWSNILAILVLCQLAFGSFTLLTLAPIVMQLGHLLLVDAIWISYVMFSASFLSAVPADGVTEPVPETV